MSKFVVKCPDCGTYVEGKTNFFVHALTCPNCGKKFNPKKEGSMVVHCEVCGNDVMFDTRNPHDQKCPVCNASLASYSIKDIEVECPGCHLHELVKNNEIMHECPVCGRSFNVQQAKARKEAKTDTASIITVPYGNTNVIWVHPETSFPYASQVIVPEGYTALILRNGRCSLPSMPGNYILSESLKSVDEQLKDAVFSPSDQVSVQIIFVKNNIDSRFNWTNSKIAVPDRFGEIAGTLGFGGEIQLAVADSKKLAEFVGYNTASVDDLIGSGRPVNVKVQNECFSAGYDAFTSAVAQGREYRNLDLERPRLEGYVKNIVNDNLAEIGLKVVFFALQFITFVEDDTVALSKKIKGYIEKPIRWKSEEIKLSTDLARYTYVQFGGEAKFRILDDGSFFSRSEIQNWVENGVTEQDLKQYFTDLAESAANDVLSTCVPREIKERNADIIDLSEFYPQLKSIIRGMLEDFFNGYGLAVESFTFRETNRKDSEILRKEAETARYMAGRSMDASTHKFNNQIEIDIYKDDSEKTVAKDTIDVNTETKLTDNEGQRTANTMKGIQYKYDINDFIEKKERERQNKYVEWNKEDQKTEHESVMTGYQYSQEESQALHYLNEQTIKQNAEELRAKWEEESKLEYDRLLHNIRMQSVRDDASGDRTLKDRKIAYAVSQGDAENDRVINGIIRKIAESDLELREKIDAYERILNNTAQEDNLRHFIDKMSAMTKLRYEDGHITTILTDEENKVYEDAKSRELERLEKAKDADFMRSLRQQELTIAYEMEKLKMQYDADKEKRESDKQLREKDHELTKLQMMLKHYQELDDNEVQRLGIREWGNVIRSKAESEMQIEIARKERMEAERREKEELDREERYSKRADDLLTRILSIQEAMRKLGFENEKVYIQEQAGVAKARAAADASASAKYSSDINRLIKELEIIARNLNHQKKHNDQNNKKKSDGGVRIPPIPTVDIKAGTTGGDEGVQPGTKLCPHCKRPIPEGIKEYCPLCYKHL